MSDKIEKAANYEILELHKYKVTLSGKSRDLAFPYIKTSAILKIFLGTSGEFRDLVKSMFNQETMAGGKVGIDKIAVLNKALDMLNNSFANSIVDAFTEVINIALNEYDETGLKSQGNCNMMSPEDVNTIFRVVVHDLGEVLKNVFGMEATKKRVRKEKLPSQDQEKTEPEIPAATE